MNISNNNSDILDDDSKMTDADDACDTLAIETDVLVDPSSKFAIADYTDFHWYCDYRCF